MELLEHQRTAVDNMFSGCVLTGGVGSGKTYTALAHYQEKICGGDLDRQSPMASPVDLLVITTAKKRDELDWESSAAEMAIFKDPEFSYGNVSIKVDSWQNIKKYVAITNTHVVFDEQKLVGGGAWVKAFLTMVKRPGVTWVMLSATPADTWLDYIPLFLAHGFFRNKTQFMQDHVIWRFTGKYPEIRGFFGERTLEKYRDSILVDMPIDRHTTRHLVAEVVEHDKDLFSRVWKKRWNVYTDEPLIDAAEMHRIGRKVVNSDPSRLAALRRLWDKHPRMIVFYSFDYELEMLRTLGELDPLQLISGQSNGSLSGSMDDVEVAEWNGHKHQPVPTSPKWLYLVQYQAGSEAWNCITTDTVVYFSLTYSHKLFEQSQGRIDRLNTPFSDLWYYILMSTSKIDQLIWKALLAKKNFHEGRNVRFDGPSFSDKYGQKDT